MKSRHATALLELLVTLRGIAPGDGFMIKAGCDRQFATCKAYGNAPNFRGEHLTPVADTALSVPGAYVTQQGSA